MPLFLLLTVICIGFTTRASLHLLCRVPMLTIVGDWSRDTVKLAMLMKTLPLTGKHTIGCGDCGVEVDRDKRRPLDWNSVEMD